MMPDGCRRFKSAHLLYFIMEVINTEAKIVGDGDVKCAKCHHMLSSVGREVGLAIWDLRKQKWVIVCASERCSGIPEGIEIKLLQNYWLRKTCGGTACACPDLTKDDIKHDHNISICKICGGVC